MSTVRDVMTPVVVTIAPSASLAEAATVMAQRRVGAALVLDQGELIGIFTERDIVRALSQSFDAARDEVEHWMTRQPSTIDPSVSSEEAGDRMLEHGFRHLPVVENGRLVGMISMRDLVRSP